MAAANNGLSGVETFKIEAFFQYNLTCDPEPLLPLGIRYLSAMPLAITLHTWVEIHHMAG
jgi:hypothetical protein